MIFTLAVPGKPLPKGSLRHVGHGRMIEQTKVKDWMKVIQSRIDEVYLDGLQPFEAPVTAMLEFRFPRPAAAKNRLYPHMRSAGDIDKLIRAVLDALQPQVLVDDSLVVSIRATKQYETPEKPAGVYILVEELA